MSRGWNFGTVAYIGYGTPKTWRFAQRFQATSLPLHPTLNKWKWLLYDERCKGHRSPVHVTVCTWKIRCVRRDLKTRLKCGTSNISSSRFFTTLLPATKDAANSWPLSYLICVRIYYHLSMISTANILAQCWQFAIGVVRCLLP